MKLEKAKESLQRYEQGHVRCGGFLNACLENDLVGAIHRADPESLAILPQIVHYLWNEVRSDAWGSPDIVNKWLNQKGSENDPKEQSQC